MLGIALTGLGSVAALYQLIALAVAKVRAGEGLETYRTVWLVEFSYIGLLISLGAIVVALVVGVFFWWREERLWRDFENKYGSGKPNA